MQQVDKYIKKMKNEGLPEPVIDLFKLYFLQLESGFTGLIPESSIDPVEQSEIDSISDLKEKQFDKNTLNKVVCIKLNGGLGTTMGLQGPKSLIPVKNDLTFIDITAKQLIHLNRQYSTKIPLILMNSFKTHEISLQALGIYPELKNDIPQAFVQNKFPKVLSASLQPASAPVDPALEWNPPGHGDIYVSFLTSGILEELINHGYQYAFVSNIDNLGATLDPSILNYFIDNKCSFLMEVTHRTWMDRKGGHLARQKDGKLILRELAQCPQSDHEYFQDINKHRYFNTNNIWVDLFELQSLLKQKNNLLVLPMIRNKKKLDPLDKSSPDVYQIESAIGTAISLFDRASALNVPRKRFAPVKNCEELLLLWSDAFILSDDYQISRNPARKYPETVIRLDEQFYSFIDQLKNRFPDGAPSLINCSDFSIEGDVVFGKNAKCNDSVKVRNNSPKQTLIKENSNLAGLIEIN